MNKYFSFAFSLFFIALISAVLAISDKTIGMTDHTELYFLTAVAVMIAGFVFAIIGFRKADK